MSVPTTRGFYVGISDKWIPTITVSVQHYPGKLSKLLENIACRHDDGRVTYSYKGLMFDGGSKPRFSWHIFGHPWNEYLLAYVDHDQQRMRAQFDYVSGAIQRKVYFQNMRQADIDFLGNMEWLKRNILDREGSMSERVKIRIKYIAVRVNAYYRLFKDRRNTQ